MSLPAILASADETTDDSGLGKTYTDPDTGAWVTVKTDLYPDSCSPIADHGQGVNVAYTGYDTRRFTGTIDGIDDIDDLKGTCPRCEGSGEDPERMAVVRYNVWGWEVLASGTQDAMDYVCERGIDKGERVDVRPAVCTQCDGECEVPVSLGEYLREEHGALAYYESSTGGYSQGDDASFVVIISEDIGYDDLQAAAKAWADEYAAWARGDVYLIEYGTASGTIEGPIGGYIGDDHAESAAAEYLAEAIAEVEAKRKENVVLGTN